MKRLFFLLFGLSMVTIMAGCGGASTLVSHPNDGRYKSAYVMVAHSDPKVAVSMDRIQQFEDALRNELYFEENAFYKGQGLVVSYQFVRFEEGDRLKRFVTAGISDTAEGSLIIETTFLTSNGKKVGSIETHAHVSGGFFGGSLSAALEKAAKEIAQYAKATFK